MRGEVCGIWLAGGRCASSVQERGIKQNWGYMGTQNIHVMSVTLEVSKLSGWLNADAPCGGSKGGACGEWRGMRDGRRAAAVQ